MRWRSRWSSAVKQAALVAHAACAHARQACGTLGLSGSRPVPHLANCAFNRSCQLALALHAHAPCCCAAAVVQLHAAAVLRCSMLRCCTLQRGCALLTRVQCAARLNHACHIVIRSAYVDCAAPQRSVTLRWLTLRLRVDQLRCTLSNALRML
ncbi:hypothetical protein KOW79_013515 [Hemibagrus wyckioides]|uniref:Uncharacterized protein n=1 Tax=Hemibagrus wyckioides TaxID=337641 RepID=A0A9D3NJ05_9TELE|nr:hypothetical protein KOW79_013515 [Hemibagrus wyckioides]